LGFTALPGRFYVNQWNDWYYYYLSVRGAHGYVSDYKLACNEFGISFLYFFVLIMDFILERGVITSVHIARQPLVFEY